MRLRLQALRQFADARPLAVGEALRVQQQVVLHGGDARVADRFGAGHQVVERDLLLHAQAVGVPGLAGICRAAQGGHGHDAAGAGHLPVHHLRH